MSARKTVLAILGAASLVTLGACTKTAAAADRFPGFSQAGPNGADAKWFVDLNSVARASGEVSFKAVRALDAGYAIQGLETDCQSRVLGHEGVRFKDDGTTDRVFEADRVPLDVKDVPGGAAAAQGATVIISNHDTPAARDLYRDFELHGVEVRRSLSAKAASRRIAKELVAVLRS